MGKLLVVGSVALDTVLKWSRAVTKIVLFTKFGGPPTKRPRQRTDADVERRP